MEKKMYFRVCDNADLDLTVDDLKTAADVIDAELSGVDETTEDEYEFTITPVFMTESEYADLCDKTI